MAFTATARWQVKTGGATTGAAGFDPAATMNATLTATDGDTTSPDVSCAAYTFGAGDVGHWLFIKSGTNWNPGWYRITAVNTSPNYATIDASAGNWITYTASTSTNAPTDSTSSTDGCATVASPTSGTWAIDYSQGDTSPFNPTDLVIQAASSRVTSASMPANSNPQIAGNFFRITSGTGFTVQVVYISQVTGGYYQGDKTFGTVGSTGGTAYVGGSSNSLGTIAPLWLSGNRVYVEAGAYSITSSSTNISDGCLSITVGTSNSILRIVGHAINNRASYGNAILTASGISSFTMVNITGSSVLLENLSFDGANLTSSRGLSGATNGNNKLIRCNFANFNNSALSIPVSLAYALIACSFYGCSTSTVISTACSVSWLVYGCLFYNNTSSVFVNSASNSGMVICNCLFYNNTGASTDAITFSGRAYIHNCTIDGTGRYAIVNSVSGGVDISVNNCIISNSGSFGLTSTGATKSGFTLYGCAFFNNTTANMDASLVSLFVDCVTLTSSPYVDSSAQDFRLNNSQSGKACKSKGYSRGFTSYENIGCVTSKPAMIISTNFS